MICQNDYDSNVEYNSFVEVIINCNTLIKRLFNEGIK